ncbi:hypothetical protein C0995_009924 [Termitomyces sp. Mi166|nr:hypothetical protein C0995_009924 [Termitomyces sp. Mi166\
MVLKTLNILFLLSANLIFALVTTSINAKAPFPVLSTALVLSLAPVAVDGAPIPTAMVFLEKSSNSTLLPTVVATSEVTMFVVVDLAGLSLSKRFDSATTEQNATDAGSQRTHSIEEEEEDSATNGSISRITIVVVVACVVLFFTFLLAIYLWRHYYPPRPDSLHSADQPEGYPMTQIRSTTSTAPWTVYRVSLRAPPAVASIPQRSPAN